MRKVVARFFQVVWGILSALFLLPGKAAKAVRWFLLLGLAGAATFWQDSRAFAVANPLAVGALLLFASTFLYAYELRKKLDDLEVVQVEEPFASAEFRPSLTTGALALSNVLYLRFDYRLRNTGPDVEHWFPRLALFRETRGKKELVRVAEKRRPQLHLSPRTLGRSRVEHQWSGADTVLPAKTSLDCTGTWMVTFDDIVDVILRDRLLLEVVVRVLGQEEKSLLLPVRVDTRYMAATPPHEASGGSPSTP